MSFTISKNWNEMDQQWDLHLNGEIDLNNCNQLKDEFSNINDEHPMRDVHIYAENLDYIDSTGLGVLIGGLKKVRKANKDIYIHNVKPNVRKIFTITGLDKIFKLEG